MTARCDDNRSGRNHSVGAHSRTAVQQRQSKRAGTRACLKRGPNSVAKPDGPAQPRHAAHTSPWPLLIGSRTHGLPPTSAHQSRQRGPPGDLVRGRQDQGKCAACDDGPEQVPRHPRLRTDGEAAICSDGRHERGVDRQ